MRWLIQISLLLAALATIALSLSPEDLSSAIFLLPANSKCATNFGKDSSSSYGLVYSPEFFFYDGVRCKSQLSRNATTGFVVGASRKLKDVFDVVKLVGEVVVLTAQAFETGSRYDRIGEMKRRSGVVLCGERGLHEVLFVSVTKNNVLNVRSRQFQVEKGDLYAFVDALNPIIEKKTQSVNETRICAFRQELWSGTVIGDVEGDNFFSSDRGGLIAGAVLGGVVLVVFLCGIVFVVNRKVRVQEGGPDTEDFI